MCRFQLKNKVYVEEAAKHFEDIAPFGKGDVCP
jgi:hypothetical protein